MEFLYLFWSTWSRAGYVEKVGDINSGNDVRSRSIPERMEYCRAESETKRELKVAGDLLILGAAKRDMGIYSEGSKRRLI